MNNTTPRLMIRQKVYRGRDGFSIYGRDAYGRSVRIFAETRTSAEFIRDKVRAGQEITLADFAR